MRFELPEPPSPNTRPRHAMAAVRWKNDYKRRVWMHACKQRKPMKKPPEIVTINAVVRLRNLRDPDNLHASMKYLLDALRLPHGSEKDDWKLGVHQGKAFFTDDDPGRLTINVTQEIDRKNRGVSLEILDAQSDLF